MKKLAIALSIMILASGCVQKSTAHSGKDFDETKASQLVSGKTTDSQLVSIFGEPVRKQVVNDHEVKWIYEYVTSTTTGKTLSSNAEVDENTKILEVLVRDGVVVNHGFTNLGPTKLR
ncbi:hypothetical protein ACLIN0_11745 [Pantoea agglomerans]|uniref:hypothetical protein n=1 Tax=Enterobacter agglomerans TaxID=549 RepID=UPI0039858E2C